MRGTLGILLLCALVIPAWAGLEWEHVSLTIDAEPFDEETTGVFAFTNTGSEPIEIVEVHTSCGCTVPELEKRTYAPGERGELRAVFSFDGRDGQQVKTISVATDDPDSKFHDLTLTVNIPKLLDVSPYFVVWRKGQPADPKTISVRVLIPDILQITGVESRDERFTTEFAAVPDTPGSFDLTITPKNTDEEAQASVIVRTNAPGDNPRVITVYALVR